MFWENKRVLISGGTGFIGKNLVQKLTRKNAKPIPFGRSICDLTKMNEVEEYFSKLHEIDMVIHLATYQRTGDIQYKIQGKQFYTNTLINFNLLNAWRNYLPEAKLLSTGCSCSYPEKNNAISEDNYWEGKLNDSVEAYGFVKKLIQVGQKVYAKQFGLKSVHVILSTVYGPDDNYEDGKSHFIAALIKRIIEAKRNSSPEVVVWGDGSQVRECLYIDDQIDALLIAAETLELELINVGGNIHYTIKKVAETIKDVVGYEGRLVYDHNKFTGAQYKVLDSKRFKELTNWVPKETLKSGIEKTVKWYELHHT